MTQRAGRPETGAEPDPGADAGGPPAGGWPASPLPGGPLTRPQGRMQPPPPPAWDARSAAPAPPPGAWGHAPAPVAWGHASPPPGAAPGPGGYGVGGPPVGPPRRGRGALVAGAVVAVVVLLAGMVAGAVVVSRVGEDDGAPDVAADPIQAVRDAAIRSRGVDRALVEADLALSGDLGEEAISIEGQFDFDEGRGSSAITASEGTELIAFALITDGERAWVSLDSEVLPELPGGAEWIEGTNAELLEAEILDPPRGTFAILGAVEGTVEATDAGVVEADGEELRRYDLVLDLDLAAERLEGAEAEELAGAFSLRGDEVEVTAEAYLDGDGYLRDLRVVGDVSSEGLLAASGRLRYDLAISEIGRSFDLPALPDPGETVPFAEVAHLFG